jgi:VanZ family protein
VNGETPEQLSDGFDRLTIQRIAQLCSVAAIILVAITALGPAQWQPRTSLSWQFDHVFGYFIITLLVLFAWPRPVVVGPVLMIFAMALEALQGLTPDRIPNLWAALYGAAGVLMAASVVELFIRTKRRPRDGELR